MSEVIDSMPAAVAAHPVPVIRVRNLVKRYSGFEALRGVSLDVMEGEVVAVIGPSGSGKSTLVRCLHQLESIDGGAAWLDEELLGFQQVDGHLRALGPRAVARQRCQLGMVFQQFVLFPHKTAEGSVPPSARAGWPSRPGRSHWLRTSKLRRRSADHRSPRARRCSCGDGGWRSCR